MPMPGATIGLRALAAFAMLAVWASATTLAQGAKDIIGRPADLDLSKGVQAPRRDASKLPTTFAEAAKTQPVNAKWDAASYRPKNRRDLTGIWINQGGIGWTPGIAPGAAQKPPLN